MLTPFLIIALAIALIVAGIRTSSRRSAAAFLITAGALLAWGSSGTWVKIRPHLSRRTPPSLVTWTAIDAAQAKAGAAHQFIMYDFSADWCEPCRQMERSFEKAPIASAINRQFVAVRVVDRMMEDGKNLPAVQALQRRYGVRAFPTIIFADATLDERERIVGYNPAQLESLVQHGIAAPGVPLSVERIDDAGAPLDWKAYPYAVNLQIAPDHGRSGHAMRMDFDFASPVRYASARKEVDLELPSDYQFSFWIRADAPVNNLEFKVVDPSNKNVWWMNRRDFLFPHEWKKLIVRKKDLEFAWGPAGGGSPHHIGAIEIVVTAVDGGKGTIWIDDLSLERLDSATEPPQRAKPIAARSDPNRGSARSTSTRGSESR